jgi:hypothetical protein
MKNNGMVSLTAANGAKLEPVEAFINDAFCVVEVKPITKKQKTVYRVSHINSGAYLFDEQTEAIAKAGIAALNALDVDWSAGTSINFFTPHIHLIQSTWQTAKEALAAKRESSALARSDARNERAVILEAGVDFDKAPKAAPYKIRTIVTSTYRGAPWWTDGYFMVKGAAPAVKNIKQREIVESSFGAPIPARFDYDVVPVFVFSVGSRELVCMSNGAIMDYPMFSFIIKAHKGATIRANGKLTPFGFFDASGDLVAVQMPVSMRFVENIPTHINNRIANVEQAFNAR